MSLHKVDPELPDILDDFKRIIFSELNCIQIGKINSFKKEEMTAEIEIQMKVELENGDIKSYPKLVDCPCFVLQGGKAFMEFPIEKDDYCIVLFNDRDIDNWWSSGNVKEPKSSRKHSLSDGIAIIGINPKSNVLTLLGSIVQIVTNDNPFKLDAKSKKITLNTTGDVEITNAANIKMLGATQSYVKGDLTSSQFDTLLNLIKFHIHPCTVSDPISGTLSGTTTPPTNAGSMNNPISLSDKIKGE